MKTSYPSTISSRVALFFAASIFILGVIFAVIQFSLSLKQLQRLDRKAHSSLIDLSNVNYQLQLKAITPFARELLEALAQKYSILISEKLRNNITLPMKDIPGLYELSTKDITLDGAHVGYFTLVDKTGKIIFSYKREKYEGKNIRDFENGEIFSNNLEQTGDDNFSADSFFKVGEYEWTKFKKTYYLVSEKIPESEYILLGFVDLAKAIKPIFTNYTEEQKNIIDSLDSNLTSEFTHSWFIGFSIFFGVVILLSLIFAFAGVFLAKSVTRPIVELRDAVAAISDGDFDAKVKESGTVETIHLARTFNRLGDKLKKYMQNLRDETIRYEAVQTELRIAFRIQTSLLPSLTKEFRRDNFFLSAFFKPAKEVGGDFYDFFYVDEAKENLALILGDISGKGVPAALFMAVIKTTLRNFCLNFNLLSPGKILTKVNSEIYLNNPEGMFATVFLMYYEIKTGVLSYANAGHHASIHLKSSEKTISQFGVNEEPLMGIFSESEYRTETIQLQKTDSVICYTDGLTDSTSPDGEQFGEEKLMKLIENNIDKRADEIIEIVSIEAVEFQKNNLFDDITLLSLVRNS